MPAPKDPTTATTAPPDLHVVAMAVLTLLVDEREARIVEQSAAQPTDILLDEAGLNSNQIAALVHKTPGAVRKTLSRARTQSKKADR